MQEMKIIGKMDLTSFEKQQSVTEQPKKVLKTLPQVTVTFFTNNKKGIIGKCENNKVAFILSKCNKPVKADETWLCNVVKEEDRFNVIEPLTMLRTVDQNANDMLSKLQALKENGFNKEGYRSKDHNVVFHSKY